MPKQWDCSRWIATTLLGALCLLAVAQARAAPEGKPQRVVSFNLCADQLVLALADPEHIAGLSPYAADPEFSVMADQARAFPRLDWQAETTIALAPDLVLVGPIDRGATRRMLEAQNVSVVEIELVTNLDAARIQIQQIAALLGHPERGERMVRMLDERRARLARLRPAHPQTALAIERNGYAAGPSSLVAALLAEAGFRPPAGAPAGYGGFLSLEQLIVLQPDVLVLDAPITRATDQGALYLTHPALSRMSPGLRKIVFPRKYALCGGPSVIAALDYLAEWLSGALNNKASSRATFFERHQVDAVGKQ